MEFLLFSYKHLWLSGYSHSAITAHQRSCKGYVFSGVCPSFCPHGGGGPVMHWTHDDLDLTVQPPMGPHFTVPLPPLVTSGGLH